MEGVGAASVRFLAAARALSAAAEACDLVAPGFRSPPRLVGRTRTLRRRPDGSVVIAVVLRDRPWAAVLGDMIDGIVAANSLSEVEAERARDAMWLAVADERAFGEAAA